VLAFCHRDGSPCSSIVNTIETCICGYGTKTERGHPQGQVRTALCGEVNGGLAISSRRGVTLITRLWGRIDCDVYSLYALVGEARRIVASMRQKCQIFVQARRCRVLGLGACFCCSSTALVC
jgi:hypothetical protein